MTFVLVSPNGDRRFSVGSDDTLVVGRDVGCDVPILEQGVSRRHAELRASSDGVRITDLGSRNGTWINGHRISERIASPNDSISFGSVKFLLLRETDAINVTATTMIPLDGSATMMRERVMPSNEDAVTEIAGRRFSQLVTIAQRLGGGGSVDELLTTIVDGLFDAFDADRVAIVMTAEDGSLDTRVARDRTGGEVGRSTPRAIAKGVAERQRALLTHDARADERTAGESVIVQEVRSAMAVPLLDDKRVTLGVLYVDNLRNVNAFSEDDLAFLVAFAGIAAVAVDREYTLERLRKAARVRENFERYFTPQLADRIASETGIVAPGGVRRHVVVLFSDIRGFTPIAESLAPMKLAAQLNEYFGVMVDCIFRHEGALDKFIGDALMAYWGIPAASDQDAARALLAAQDMQRNLAVLNTRWKTEGRPVLTAGIGLHAGEAFIGNIGSPRRLEYTLIGDTVNVTSKLCAEAKGGEILLSDSVHSALQSTEGLELRNDLTLARSSSRIGVYGTAAE